MEEFHKDSDCFAFVIGSHGNEKPRTLPKNEKPPTTVYYRDHCIYGTDDDTVTTKSIIVRISDVGALEGKPKLFFIQVSFFWDMGFIILLFLFSVLQKCYQNALKVKEK